MSEQILKALMQLFAIIASPQSNRNDRRTVVENFLLRLLNADLVKEYLTIFDEYYGLHQNKLTEKGKSDKRTSSISVRVLLICTELNEELTQKQKLIVLVQLLEFVRTYNPEETIITEQEMVFVSTVAELFNIPPAEFKQIHNFVISAQTEYPDNSKIIIINNQKTFGISTFKHLYSEGFEGEARVIQVTYANIYLLKYFGENEIYLNGQLLSPDRIYVFNNGSSIRNPFIKPIYFSDIVSFFNERQDGSKIIFEVKHIEYRFKGGKMGL